MADKRDRKERTRPDYLMDVISAVDMMDAKKRLKEDFSKEHAKAVKFVQLANNANGPGYISISKARTLIQLRYTEAQGKSEQSRDKERSKATR